MTEASIYGGMEQRQALSQTMQKNLQILQASSAELRHLISTELDSNPVLEEANFDYFSSDDFDEWEDITSGGSDHEAGVRYDFLMNSLVSPETLNEYLLSQIHTSELEPDEIQAVEYLIGSLDNRGYLDAGLDELSEASGLPEPLLEKGLQILRGFDPPGVGALNLRDSLLIQLERSGEKCTLAWHIINDTLEVLAQRRYDVIAEQFDCTTEDVHAAAERISQLNPNPGAPFGNDQNKTISPDVEVWEEESAGGFEICLTKGTLPILKLNDGYKETLAESSDRPEVRKYLKGCFQEARQLMQAIEMRQHTLQKLAAFIVQKETDFFRHGRAHLKPLVMNEAAEALDVHPATISRAVSGKYLLCKHGLYEFRFFFSSGFETDSGESVSSHAVREAIAALVKGENQSKPLSDNKLSEELKKQGLTVARRTVAKYREQLKILPARFRKK